MDIFTTQLTRVVPVPIKPTSLKVKALLKDAGSSKLTEDPDHLENHDLYFSRVKEKSSDNAEQEQEQKQKQQFQQQSNYAQQDNEYENPSIKSKISNNLKESHLIDDDKPAKHLDIYI